MLGIITFLAPLTIIHLLFKWYWGTDFFAAEWSAGELLGYVGACFTFTGTVTLGILALWQNDKLSKQNEAYRKMIENKDMPIIRVSISSIIGMAENINFLISNVSDNVAKNVNFTECNYRGNEGTLLFKYDIQQKKLNMLVKDDDARKIHTQRSLEGVFENHKDINPYEIGIILKLNYEDIYNRMHYCIFQQEEAKAEGMFLINEVIKDD